MSRILDPNFEWTPAVATDIRKTWARIDREADWQCRVEGALRVMQKLYPPTPSNVTRLRRKVR